MKHRSDEGMTTVSYMLATGLSLIVLTWCASFIVMSYTRAVIRSASERASRAGVVEYTHSRDLVSVVDVCDEHFLVDLKDGVSSQVLDSLSHECVVETDRLVVRTSGTLTGLGIFSMGFNIDEETSRNFEAIP